MSKPEEKTPSQELTTTQPGRLAIVPPAKASRAPKLKQVGEPKNGVVCMAPDVSGNDDLQAHQAGLERALGTSDLHLAQTLAQQASVTALSGTNDVEKCNLALAALHSIGPENSLEAMLAVQMVGVHNLAMEFLGRAACEKQPEVIDTNLNRAERLLRLYSTQAQTLKACRARGQQTIRVERVEVNSGGQAIVGAVSHSPGGA